MNDKTRNHILLVLFLGVLMGALDIAIVAPALPSIQKFFGVGDRTLTWAFTMYVLFNLIGTPWMAKLSDRYGRRAIYTLDVTLFAAGSLIVALAPAGLFGVLLAGRALQGFGAGGIFPVASAVIGDTFPSEKRGSALGMIGAVFGLAFLIGPILGGIILSFSNWQWLFLINLPIAALVIFLGLKLLPVTRPAVQRPFDAAGMAALGVALTALAYGLNQIDTQNFFSSLLSVNVLPALLIGTLALILFVRVERRAADPILNLDLFKSRQTVLASILSAGAGLGEVGMVFIPALAVAALPGIVNKQNASYLLMPVVLAMAVGSPLAGRLLDKFGSKVIVLAGTILLAGGVLMLSSGLTSLLWGFIVSGAVIGLGLSSLLGAPMRYIMLNEASMEERTAAQGVITLFTSIGQMTSSAVVGAVAASMGGGVRGYSAAYLVIGLVAAVMVVLALGLKNQRQERAVQAVSA